MKNDAFRREVERILKMGVERLGTRYECQCKLVYHFWSLGYSESQCYEMISHWYYAHDHRSKDWRNNPHRVLRNLKSAISSFYRNAAKKGFKPQSDGGNWKQLRLLDVVSISKLTRNYRMQRFLFGLMRYALNQKDSRGHFRLPWKTIMSFDCCSTESYKEKIKFCVTHGLLSIVREYYRQEHRARTYRVNFPFSNEGEFVFSLDEGLKKLFPPRILKLRTSRWVYEKYLKDDFKENQMLFCEEVE
jgi:hypothetical protein